MEILREEINKRISVARENQHKSQVGERDYHYWQGAGDALEALLADVVDGVADGN